MPSTWRASVRSPASAGSTPTSRDSSARTTTHCEPRGSRRSDGGSGGWPPPSTGSAPSDPGEEVASRRSPAPAAELVLLTPFSATPCKEAASVLAHAPLMATTRSRPAVRLDDLHRVPVTRIEAYSAATFERATLPDGTRLFLKHLPAAGDWITRGVGGADHLARLWDSGALDRLSSVVDHTILDIVQHDDHDVVIMRDASENLFSESHPPTWRLGQDLVAGLAALHAAGRDEALLPLCSLGARWRVF